MRYKYSDDFIVAITKVLLKEQRLAFNELYKEVLQALRHTERHPRKYTPSRTQFDLHIKKLVDERYLERTEDKSSKRKIKSVYYSLTDKALKEHQFDVLVNENRKNLYQFLFLFQVFSPLKRVSAKQFEEILSRIPISRNDLQSRQEGAFYLPFSFSPSERYFNRPLERLGSTQHFPIVEHLRFSAVYNPSLYVRQPKRGLGKTTYYCKLLSFSLRDLMEYMKNAKAKGPEHNFFSVPFLNEMSFSEEELGRIDRFTRSKPYQAC